MELYNVEVKASYEASYEGEINTSYSRLVYANSENEAINFVKNDLLRFDNTNSCRTEIVESAYKIDFEKVRRKRTVGYYCL
jgi:hypothetical protein